MDGILVIDKPSGMTSHDIVDFVRRSSGIKKVGHCGTLDPLATGVLVILLGKATKLSSKLSSDDKEYITTMRLGISTDTQDVAGKIIKTANPNGITTEMIRKVILSFKGKQEQIPPMVSAKHHKGSRLYKLARKGITIKRKPLPIDIKDIEILKISEGSGSFFDISTPHPEEPERSEGDEGSHEILRPFGLQDDPSGENNQKNSPRVQISKPEVEIRVVCSKGTYIRTLCHDIGQRLGCGAHMVALRRIRSGRFHIKDAISFEELSNSKIPIHTKSQYISNLVVLVVFGFGILI